MLFATGTICLDIDFAKCNVFASFEAFKFKLTRISLYFGCHCNEISIQNAEYFALFLHTLWIGPSLCNTHVHRRRRLGNKKNFRYGRTIP